MIPTLIAFFFSMQKMSALVPDRERESILIFFLLWRRLVLVRKFYHNVRAWVIGHWEYPRVQSPQDDLESQISRLHLLLPRASEHKIHYDRLQRTVLSMLGTLLCASYTSTRRQGDDLQRPWRQRKIAEGIRAVVKSAVLQRSAALERAGLRPDWRVPFPLRS